MRARILHIDERDIVTYMLEGHSDIFEMYVSPKMVMCVNEGVYVSKTSQASRKTQLPNTVIAYHKVSGTAMLNSDLPKLMREPRLAPFAKKIIKSRTERPFEEGEIYRFCFN